MNTPTFLESINRPGGTGVAVCANAVITKDVPAGATVVGANRLLPKPSPYALD